MTTSFDRVIQLEKYINVKANIEAVFGFTNVFLYTKPGKKLYVYNSLKKASDRTTTFRVFLKEAIPNYMHIRDNERTGDIWLLPSPGWIVAEQWKMKELAKQGEWIQSEHGYDILNRDMSPGFFAFGSAFRKDFKKNCIKTVDLYGLMCHILDFEPSKNNGSFRRVAPLLREWEVVHKKEEQKKNSDKKKTGSQAKNKTNFGSSDEDRDNVLIELRSKYYNTDDGGNDDDDDDPMVCE